MRNDPFTVKKQTGKVKAKDVLIVSSGTSGVTLKYADTSTYQVGPHGDYVQEVGG